MKFPLIKKGSQTFPRKPKCPMCGFKVFEPHQFVVLSGGALKITDAKNGCAEMSDDLEGFLDLTFHGAENGGRCNNPKLKDVYVMLPLAWWTRDGQFEMYFCSTKCLRRFFNECVDALEKKARRKR